MMNKSTLRLAAIAVAIACTAAADAQQADAQRDSQNAVIEGRAYRLSELNPGQPLSVSVSKTRRVLTTESGAPPETPAHSTAAPARLSDIARWAPLLVLFGVLALIGALLLMTSRRMRGVPWDSDETGVPK